MGEVLPPLLYVSPLLTLCYTFFTSYLYAMCTQIFNVSTKIRISLICYRLSLVIVVFVNQINFVHLSFKRCEECGSMFSIKSRLTTHKNTVHNQRVHTCQICDKSFQTLSLLKRHAFIHSRFKPYTCPFCNHSSNSQSNLTKHVRNIHSQTDFSYHK